MCDFAIMEKALKIAWIKRIQNEATSSWKIIADVMVQQYGNLFFLSRCNMQLWIAESDVCPLCKNERQTLYHLFVLCTEVHSFWNTFQDWWLQKTHERLSLNQSNIFYGFFEKSSYWQALNYSILIAKYHIFCTSKGRGVLGFQSFLLRLSDKIQTHSRLLLLISVCQILDLAGHFFFLNYINIFLILVNQQSQRNPICIAVTLHLM